MAYDTSSPQSFIAATGSGTPADPHVAHLIAVDFVSTDEVTGFIDTSKQQVLLAATGGGTPASPLVRQVAILIP